MTSYFNVLSLLAQTVEATEEAAATPWYQGGLVVALLVVAAFALPILAGNFLSRALRMKDYGWKLSTIFTTLVLAGVVTFSMWPPRLGIDLSGGVTLIYEIDAQRSELTGAEETIDLAGLVQSLKRRLNPSGVEDLVIRSHSDNQVEITIPNADEAEIERVRQLVTKSGFLKFRIAARPGTHDELIATADVQSRASADTNLVVRNDEGVIIGEWARVGLDLDKTTPENPVYKVDNLPDESTRINPDSGRKEVLMAVDPDINVVGDHLAAVRSSIDETARPCVHFDMNAVGAPLFGQLTSSNLPDPVSRSEYLLGIVLDDELLSAPVIQSTITSSGRITGTFTNEEVEFLVNVLREGKLPAVLQEEPVSQDQINPLLGIDTIRKGRIAIVASICTVLVFMLLYYHFPGIVACCALVSNLVLILGLMILANASFTLPGLAGLVLTVGMAVDCNVLIFERIREELQRGSALRMAVRNGFGRATTTIIDASLTTLITAIVLYAVGTDQVRGFAVTLILGILMSMYTGIFCSRVVFDIAERKRWISKLGMFQLLHNPRFDFVSKQKAASFVSVVVVLIGLVGVALRGERIFDIDFLGGSRVEIALLEGTPIERVKETVSRDALMEEITKIRQAKRDAGGDEAEGVVLPVPSLDVSIYEINPQDRPAETVYQIAASTDDVAELEQALATIFHGKLETHSVEVSGVTELTPPPADDGDPLPPPVEETNPPADDTQSSHRASRQYHLVAAGIDQPLLAQADDAAPPTESAESTGSEPVAGDTDVPPDAAPTEDTPPPAEDPPPDEPPADEPADEPRESARAEESAEPTDTPPTEEPAESADTPAEPPAEPPVTDSPAEPPPTEEPSAPRASSQAELTFAQAVTPETLKMRFVQAVAAVNRDRQQAGQVEIDAPRLIVSNPEWDGRGNPPKKAWTVEVMADGQRTGRILDHLEQSMDAAPLWLSSSKIGASVAGDTQQLAIAALLLSLLCIVFYIWVRFQRVVFGLAAVVALVHDVTITLGAIALSKWLAGALGFMMITEFKISLPVLAALLTIIGYSLNDTIVVFDRIREVRGKSPQLTGEMVNKSINQTLSRTFLTSATTLIVVLILYTFGGEGIHGFAFALLVGVMVGTYSSIFVASPVLLWMMSPGQTQKQTK